MSSFFLWCLRTCFLLFIVRLPSDLQVYGTYDPADFPLLVRLVLMCSAWFKWELHTDFWRSPMPAVHAYKKEKKYCFFVTCGIWWGSLAFLDSESLKSLTSPSLSELGSNRFFYRFFVLSFFFLSFFLFSKCIFALWFWRLMCMCIYLWWR